MMRIEAAPRVSALLVQTSIWNNRGRPLSMIVKATGPSGPAKINADDPKHALGLVHYLRTIGYKAWIEDENGNEIEETILKSAIK